MKKILQIVFNDFTNDSRVLRHSQAAIDAGYEVDVIALHRGSLPTEEKYGKLTICRIPLKTRNLPKTLPFQLLKYGELFATVLQRAGKYDIIHCNDLDPLLMSILLKKLSRKPVRVIYDAHELQTERASADRLWVNRMKSKLEHFLCIHADKFITVSPLIADTYSRKYGIAAPQIVYNCPPSPRGEGQKNDLFRRIFHIPDDKKIFLYQGLISRQRSIHKIIDAFSSENMPAHACLVLIGHGPLIQSDHPIVLHKNIFYHPPVDYSELFRYTQSADFGLLTIENNCINHDLCLPNKFFEYAMAGLPILATNLKQISAFLQEYPMGVTCPSMTPEDLIAGVKNILSQDYGLMRQNAARVAARYNWDQQSEELVKIYNSLLEKPTVEVQG